MFAPDKSMVFARKNCVRGRERGGGGVWGKERALEMMDILLVNRAVLTHVLHVLQQKITMTIELQANAVVSVGQGKRVSVKQSGRMSVWVSSRGEKVLDRQGLGTRDRSADHRQHRGVDQGLHGIDNVVVDDILVVLSILLWKTGPKRN